MKAEQERKIARDDNSRNERPPSRSRWGELAKQSLIGGFVNLGLQTASIALKKDERVVWETPGCKLKQRTWDGVPLWESDGVGTLVVTSQLVMFRADTGAMWTKPFTKLLSTNHEYIRDQGICVVWIDGQQKPVAFAGVRSHRGGFHGDASLAVEDEQHGPRSESFEARCCGGRGEVATFWRLGPSFGPSVVESEAHGGMVVATEFVVWSVSAELLEIRPWYVGWCSRCPVVCRSSWHLRECRCRWLSLFSSPWWSGSREHGYSLGSTWVSFGTAGVSTVGIVWKLLHPLSLSIPAQTAHA